MVGEQLFLALLDAADDARKQAKIDESYYSSIPVLARRDLERSRTMAMKDWAEIMRNTLKLLELIQSSNRREAEQLASDMLKMRSISRLEPFSPRWRWQLGTRSLYDQIVQVIISRTIEDKVEEQGTRLTPDERDQIIEDKVEEQKRLFNLGPPREEDA